MQNTKSRKQIKDYIIGETISNYNDMNLMQGNMKNGTEITIIMVEKKNIQQETFVSYNNLLSENRHKIYPEYIQAVQSTNNVYLILEKIIPIDYENSNALELLPSLVELYRNMGEYKLQESQVFVTLKGRLVYLPFYKKLQTSSKFYAQFHNKSVLGDLFAKMVRSANKNVILEIFIKNIDSPQAVELISADVKNELGLTENKTSYPTMDIQGQDDDDDQIMQLMSKVNVNSDMKKQANQQFMRQSAKTSQQVNDKQLKNLMDNAQTSMFKIQNVKASKKTDKSKIQVLLNQQKVISNQFEVYFKSYCQSLKFLKKCIKEFLSFYKNRYAGVISSLLLAIIITLRKAYMIKQLQSGNDIFELEVNMETIHVSKYVAYLKRQMANQVKLIAQLKHVVQNCSMPIKTYSILAPYLEQDLSLIDFNQIHTFTFFFLSALIKSNQSPQIHYMYVIECMYILLHRNYEIVFFMNDFPKKWNKQYFDTKIALIEGLVPSWTL